MGRIRNETPCGLRASVTVQRSGETKGVDPCERGSRRRWLSVSLLGVALAGFAAVCHKYVWLYLTWKPARPPPVSDLLHDPRTSNDPQVLLQEGNRLAWVFNWPKALPLYARAEELFRAKGDARNEIYARVGRIRAQSETMSSTDVSDLLGQQLELPSVKTDMPLRLWCLAAKGYTDLEINPASAKRAWTEAQTIAHKLGEAQWEARAEGESYMMYLNAAFRRRHEAAFLLGVS